MGHLVLNIAEHMPDPATILHSPEMLNVARKVTASANNSDFHLCCCDQWIDNNPKANATALDLAGNELPPSRDVYHLLFLHLQRVFKDHHFITPSAGRLKQKRPTAIADRSRFRE